MNLLRALLAGFVSVFFAVLILSIQANASEDRPQYREGEVIVKYKENKFRNRATMRALYESVDVVDIKRYNGQFKNFETLIINTDSLNVKEAVEKIARNPNVEYAQPNYMLYAFDVATEVDEVEITGEPCWFPGIPYPPGCDESLPPAPPGGGNPPDGGNPPGGGDRPAIEPAPAEPTRAADPKQNEAWGIQKVAADKAWERTRGSKDVVVAVIDTGVDYNHSDLAFNMWRNPNANYIARTGIDPSGSDVSGDVVGWDFIHDDNLPYDDNMHGTHCAGVVGAVGENGTGISGVSPRVSIMAIKFLSAQGSGDTADAIKSIDYAVSRGAQVLSNSWGGSGDDGTNGALKEAVERSEKAGALFVAAAGNDGRNNDTRPIFPAGYKVENVVAVASTSKSDRLSVFSNYGKKTVHLAAPGSGVYSTVPNEKYKKLSGTSMAAPHVAGAAALLWSFYPEADYREIKQRLMIGDEIPALESRTISGVRLNVLKALEAEI